ncbi:MAG: OmpA family protein, partial [Verrucomicrobiota bacterium]
PLVDQKVDSPDNPRFKLGSTDLDLTQDYALLWNWSKLMRSPAHRHQAFIIECHATDQAGRRENLKLSQERADTIKTYLIEKCGVDPERLTSIGKGDFELLPQLAVEDPSHNRVTLVIDNTAGARQL